MLKISTRYSSVYVSFPNLLSIFDADLNDMLGPRWDFKNPCYPSGYLNPMYTWPAAMIIIKCSLFCNMENLLWCQVTHTVQIDKPRYTMLYKENDVEATKSYKNKYLTNVRHWMRYFFKFYTIHNCTIKYYLFFSL